jgi:hypothetical protein
MASKTVSDLGPEIWTNPITSDRSNAFDLSDLRLTSLEGCPEVVNGSIDLTGNRN